MPADTRTKAKILDFGVCKNGKGDPQIFVNFDVELNDKLPVPFESDSANSQNVSNVKNINWYGHLVSEASREITMKSLLVMGFTGTELSDIANGPEGKALDVTRLIDVVCGEEEYEGKVRMKIKFINAPGAGTGNIERFDAKESKKLLAGINTKQLLAKVKEDNPHLAEVAAGKKLF